MATTTSRYELVDRLLDGNLGRLLTDLRDKGLSYDDIAMELALTHNIRVSRGTIGRWLDGLAS